MPLAKSFQRRTTSQGQPANSPSSPPDWPGGHTASHAPRSRRRSPPSSNPGGCPGSYSTTLVGDTPSDLRITWRTKPSGTAAAGSRTVRQADHLHRPSRAGAPPAVVADYRSQSEVETDFRQTKDPLVVSFSPMFHWTDQKIRVHVAYCVLALTVARLMVQKADRDGSPERA